MFLGDVLERKQEFEALGSCPGPKPRHMCYFVFPPRWPPVARKPSADVGRSSCSPRCPEPHLAEQHFTRCCLQNPRRQASVLPCLQGHWDRAPRLGECSPWGCGPGKENEQFQRHRESHRDQRGQPASGVQDWPLDSRGRKEKHAHGCRRSRLLGMSLSPAGTLTCWARRLEAYLPECRVAAGPWRRVRTRLEEAQGHRAAVPRRPGLKGIRVLAHLHGPCCLRSWPQGRQRAPQEMSFS